MSKLIKLHKPRRDHRDDERIQQIDYEESVPFFLNQRGVLVHRVKSLYQLTATWQEEPWWIVDYWCENFGRTDKNDLGMLEDPGDRLICTRCEANAIAHGLPTSSELVGRHICTGTMRPVNTCCFNEDN